MEKFIKKQKIKFAHCDAAGIVFYPRFYEMINELVEDWFEEALDLSFKKLHEYGGVPTVSMQTQFKNPARLGDIITKVLWVKNLSSKSLTYQFQFYSEEKIILEGECSLVYVKMTEGKLSSSRWDDDLMEKVKFFMP